MGLSLIVFPIMSISVFISLVVCLLSLVSAIQMPRYLCGVLGLDVVMSLFPNLIVTGREVELASFFAISSSVFCGLMSMSCTVKKLVAMSRVFLGICNPDSVIDKGQIIDK